MFNIKEFTLNNLINGVNNKSFSKEYASILATNYLLKGFLSEEDIQKFDEATKVESVTEDVTLDTEDITPSVEETTYAVEETKEEE